MIPYKLTHPKICPLCGGHVIFSKTEPVYGKHIHSGYCYVCTSCHTAVATHKYHPDQAMATLADQKTKLWRGKCHNLFDKLWKNGDERKKQYKKLAELLNISEDECHFGFMNLEQLQTAYEILKKLWREKYDI